MSALLGNIPEPVVRTAEVFDCPVCGQTFMDRALFDAHANGCSIDGTVGRFVRFRFDGEDRVGRIIAAEPGRREFDEFENLSGIGRPSVTVVFPYLDSGGGFWVQEEEIDPGELEEVDRFCLESEVRKIGSKVADDLLREIEDAGGEGE